MREREIERKEKRDRGKERRNDREEPKNEGSVNFRTEFMKEKLKGREIIII